MHITCCSARRQVIENLDASHHGLNSQLEKENKTHEILGRRDTELQVVHSNSASPAYCDLHFKSCNMPVGLSEAKIIKDLNPFIMLSISAAIFVFMG